MEVNLGGNIGAETTTSLEPNTIIFNTEATKEPIIVLKNNGDIFIKGRLAENDKEVVDAMREFLKSTGHLK